GLALGAGAARGDDGEAVRRGRDAAATGFGRPAALRREPGARAELGGTAARLRHARRRTARDRARPACAERPPPGRAPGRLMPEPPLEARGLTKRFGSTTAVEDLTFAIEPGRITGFLGPNGAGKT